MKITSVQNPLVKHLVKLRENARYRSDSGSLVVTGVKLVTDLSKFVSPIKILFFDKIPPFSASVERIEVSDAVMKKITGQKTPDKIAAEFPLPEASALRNVSKLLVLDQISDPGNLGTLLRTALALGWQGVFFLPNCVDPFNEKAVRASQGALFQLEWTRGGWQEMEQLKKKNQLSALIADIEGIPFQEIKKKDNLLLILSHEGIGVSEKGEQFGQKITIPMSGKMESLNVASAGAILMYGLIHGR